MKFGINFFPSFRPEDSTTADYYEQCLRLLRSGGLIMLDNVLRSGTVLDETDDDPRSVATREVNERAIADERVDVAMLGVADGITLALKR